MPISSSATISHESTDQSNCNSTQAAYRSIPWFILGNKTIKSTRTAIVLGVLWSSIPGVSEQQSRGRRIYSCLTNDEISKRSGLNCTSEDIRYHLTKLENLGLIKRHGDHKNRTIEILAKPENGDYRCLIISQEIFSQNISISRKLVLAIKSAFSRMSNNTICDRISMSKWSLWYNSRPLNEQYQPPKESNTNPQKNPMQPPKESNCIGKEGEVIGVLLAKANSQPLQVGRTAKSSSAQENIMTSEQIEFYKPYLNSRSVRSIKPSSAQPILPDELVNELKYIFTLDHIRKHRPDSKIYFAAARLVRALKKSKGLSTILEDRQMNEIISDMERQGVPKDKTIAVLHKCFTEEERVLLYDRISDHFCPEFGYKGKENKVNLTDCLYNENFKFSLLVKVWLIPPTTSKPPTPIKPPTPVEIPEDLKPAVDVVKEYVSPEPATNYMINCLKEMMSHHKNEIIPYLDRINESGERNFTRWLTLYLKNHYNKKGCKMHPAALKMSSPEFTAWDSEWQTEQWTLHGIHHVGRMARKDADAKDKRERYEAFCDAHGLDDTPEQRRQWDEWLEAENSR